MPQRNADSPLRAAVSVSGMARMVGLSRAAFYGHVQRGTFLPPVYSISTRRPYYPREMQARNLEVRAMQEGINGDFVLFYERTMRPRTAPPRRRAQADNLAANLQERLESLGLAGVTEGQVGAALASCYPRGCSDVPENDVLRVIYRWLRRLDRG